ncbi:hypothetical protein CRG98_016215 [Punica granatum]|uniref:Uncharacterized protein n=1 Tax=Punica granatum TaxID=22663 RepID=A0A2I0K4C0_PUNGR|nr:hypothetical protein CRG98_016215 [Punica granatum]
MPRPGQTRNDERKLGKKIADPIRRKWMKRGLCTVVWLSDRDRLFTGESEGCEGLFERDGTTRRSRGRKWHARKFGDVWLKSGRAVIGIPGGFPLILAGLGHGTSCARMRGWAGG